MTTSSSSKSPSSPLLTIIAPTTLQTSVTSVSSVMSSSSSISTPLVSTVSSSSSSNSNNNNNNNNCNNNSKHVSVKCENTYGNSNNSSCNNENNNTQTMDDSGHKILMKSNGRNPSSTCKMVNITANHERDTSASGALAPTIRQNTTNINNCSLQYREASPNNSGNNREMSNTSNSTIPPKSENINNDEEKKAHIKEEEREKSNNSTSSVTSLSSISSNTNFASLSSTTNSLTTTASGINKNISNIEEDKDVAIKEEHNISPNMSPVGFSCSIDTGSHSNGLAIPETSASNANLNDVTNDKHDSKVHIIPAIGSNGNSNNVNNNEEPNNNNNNQTSSISGHNTGHSYNSNPNVMMSLNNGNSGGTMVGGNCVDYMQHQNHIFVFSTQLANKSADAVLNGQFPTIIAYHCTQPSTKSFLEDFFLKNSMKMTKLQRQNTLNMCNMSIGNSGELLGGQLWLNTLSKLPQKLSTNKNGDDCDILLWDQTRTDIDISNGAERTSMNNLENSEMGRSSGATSKSLVVNELDSSNVPSLQGTKVPDENLTPQQRQHRVEQLAKLKKIGLNLFPENDNTEFRTDIANSQSRKISVDSLGNATTNPMMHMTPTNSPNCNNTTTSNKNSVHNNNVMKTEGMSALVDAVSSMPSDIIGSSDLSMLSQYGPNKSSNNIHLNNPISGALTNSMGINISNILPNLSGSPSLNNIPPAQITNVSNNSMTKNTTMNNMHNNGLGSLNGNSNGLNDENNRCNNVTTDVSTGFGPNFSTALGEGNNILETDVVNHKHISASNNDHQGISGAPETGNIGQMEWSTLQQQFYGERLKSNVPDGTCNVAPSPSSTTRTNSTMNLNTRSSTTSSISTVSSNLNNHRPIQGPPPPYHQSTANQRPASVPITSQSPNPVSPNNPTSNLSLPSPRTSSIMGMTNNSPNMENNTVTPTAVSSSSSTPNSVSVAAVSGGNSGCVSSNCVNNISKISFSQEHSPTNNQTSNIVAGGGGGNTICNRNNNNATLNNYPSSTLSEVSSKELETNNLTSSSADISKMESTFSNSALICSGGMGNSSGGNTNSNNTFKNQTSSLERQNTVQMASQFNRRADNIPLNPNNNRIMQNKMVNSFDPISSLAQMSQQLTGCVGGLGNSPNNMGLLSTAGGPGGINDMSSGINMDGSLGPMDSSMDHCSTSGNGNIAVTGCGGSSAVSFASNNCHIMGPMPQRLMNSKMCGPSGGISSFNATAMNIKGDHPSFSSIIPSHRMANHHRMSSNFGSFNMAPNIQVKASTPNTIQYLPVRTQSNSTSNIRVPPSLEFLQRYTNPQIMGATLSGGPTPCTMENSSLGNQMASQNEMNKLNSSANNIGVNMNQGNFFGACHSLNTMSSIADQDDLQGGGVVSGSNNNVGNGGIMSNHDIQMGPQGTLLRGLRPMRQTCMNQAGAGLVPNGPRMQHPIMGGGKRPPSTGPASVLPFTSNGADSMDMSEQTPPIFNSGVINGSPGSMQVYQQKGGNKSVRDNGAMPSSLNNNGSAAAQNGLITNDPSALQSSVLPGGIGGGRPGLNNNNILSNSLNMNGGIISSGCAPGSPMNYKSFVGPTSNDLKYAQQFHSFQQQLYATSVRGQQPGNVSNALHTNNNNTNTNFFVNK